MGRYRGGDRVPVPPVDADFWQEIVYFALTYNGYGHHPDVMVVMDIHHRLLQEWEEQHTLDRPLDELRCALFFVQRRYHDDPGEPEGDERRFVEALLDAIRRVSGGTVTVDPGSWAAGGDV